MAILATITATQNTPKLMKQFYYIANWKMLLTYRQVQDWLAENGIYRNNLGGQLIICPSYESLGIVATEAQKGNFSLGAQDCSEYHRGAHTGQVSAQSLAEIGCTYCIVAHSEQRKNITCAQINQKLAQLANNKITPVFCIEEPTHEQLEPAQQFIAKFPEHTLLIAYEPPSAIGSGTAASIDDIIKTQKIIMRHLPSATVRYIYGGSVLPENSGSLKAVSVIDGFLIGKASTETAKLHAILASTVAI